MKKIVAIAVLAGAFTLPAAAIAAVFDFKEQNNSSLESAWLSSAGNYADSVFDEHNNMNRLSGNDLASVRQFDGPSVSTLLAERLFGDIDPMSSGARNARILTLDGARVNSMPERLSWIFLILSGPFFLGAVFAHTRESNGKPIVTSQPA